MTSDLHLDAVRDVESRYVNGDLTRPAAIDKLCRLGYSVVEAKEVLDELDNIKIGFPED